MKAGGSSPRQPSSQSRVPWFIAMAVVAALGTLLGIVQVFGTFMGYDDEGYMMAVVGRMLSGKVLYKEVPTVYGPFYFLFKHVLHAVLGIPLTNNATRVVSLISTVCVSGLLSWTTFRLTRNLPLTLLSWVFSIIHVRVLGLQPGHPQELISILLGLFAVAVLRGGENQKHFQSSLVFGLIGGALVATKLNVGVLFFASVLLAEFAGDTSTRWKSVLFMLVVGAVLALPFLIIGSSAGEPRFLLLAGAVSGAILSVLIVSTGRDSVVSRNGIIPLAIGFGVALAICLGFSVFMGASLADITEAVWLAPKRLATNLPKIPTKISVLAVPLTLVSLIVVTIHRNQMRWLGPSSRRYFESLLMWAKLGYSLWLFRYFLAGRFVALEVFLAPGACLLWLALIRPNPSGSTTLARRIRLLATVAALQPMQVFPVSAAQSAIGTLLLIPISLFCFFDFVLWAKEHCPMNLKRADSERAWNWASVLSVVGILVFHAYPQWVEYAKLAPVPAKGANWVRIPKEKAETYAWLIRKLKDHGKPFVTTTGFNSLHVWTGLEARTPVIIGNSLDIFSPEQLQSMVAELEKHPDSIVVRHPTFSSTPPMDAASTNMLLGFVSSSYEVLESRDSFELMTRKGRLPTQQK